jgi:hypothetical protein
MFQKVIPAPCFKQNIAFFWHMGQCGHYYVKAVFDTFIHMKKFLLAVLMVAMFPGFAMAQSISDTDVDPAGTSVSSCVSLTSNMRYRMRDTQTNGGVSELQDFLNTKGFLNYEPTGFFGIATLKAVKDYQASIGLSPTGYVGSLTRAKINATCGGSESTTSSRNFPHGCTSTSGYADIV